MNAKKCKAIRAQLPNLQEKLQLSSEVAYVHNTRIISVLIGTFQEGLPRYEPKQVLGTIRLKPTCVRYFYKKMKRAA